MAKPRTTMVVAAAGAALAALTLVACQNYGQPKSVADASEAIPDHPDYSWDVRPILSQNCFQCHGNDGKNRKAGLRLDVAEAAYGKLPEDPSKRAIIPGNPKKSEVFRRITSTDRDVRMPPREAHKTLTARDIAILERWIKQGAKYKPHWAYILPKEVKPARSAWDKQAVNPIDRYVYGKLQAQGLAPSPEADRETLINRVTLDLTGLPPTLQEVDAFVADKSPNAYEKLVDRLLDSTPYAERQANIWLDVARYADSDGFLNDQIGRFQHPYRDWVISAFKRNIPYDRFVTWQLAGDKLPNATREQVLATYFVRAGKRSNEGGITDEEYRVEYVNERAELIGKAFLGLTVGCAKCHDHKYDVISQADYYSMGGFFNSIDERGIASGAGRSTPMGPTQAWPTPLQAKTLAAAKAKVREKEQAYETALKLARAQSGVSSTNGAGALLAASLNRWQQAYYPLDTTYKASTEPLQNRNDGPPTRSLILAQQAAQGATPGGKPAGKPGVVKVSDERASRRGPPVVLGQGDPNRIRTVNDDIAKAVAKVVAAGKSAETGAGASGLSPTALLTGLSEAVFSWTPNAVAGGPPGGVNNGHVVPGPSGKGQAVLINDTIGFAGKNVGQFDRSDPFSLDVWVKLRADKPYDEANILFNSDKGGAGYELNLVENHLVFTVQHITPYNMITVSSLEALPRGKWVHLTATYDGSSKASGQAIYADGRQLKTEVLHDYLTRQTVPRGGSGQFGSYTGLSFGRRFGMVEMNKAAIDEIRVFTKALNPLEVAYLHDPRSAAPDLAALQDVAAAQDPRVIKAFDELRAARDAETRADTPIYQMMVVKDSMKPRPTYLLERGNFDQHGKVVPIQALPRVFGWKESLPKNRLGLTQWLFDPKNPMTSRVYVNRLWQSHFGTGIVETVEDFGTQGANPTNPALLDYLAIEFIRSGWDIRHMHKLMVMSATYRQDSTITPDRLEKDPRNFLLARGPRYRLSAEQLRDNALMASGLLVRTVGGDAVFPYQPPKVWDGAGVGIHAYPDVDMVPKDQMHRRSMYTVVQRNAQFPSMVVFDLADRNVSTVARKISNTPLQGLVLLNDPQYLEAYRKLAERAIKASPASPDQQITTLFRLAVRRSPRPTEMAGLRAFRTERLAEYTKHPDKAEKLSKIGVADADPSLNKSEVAAMSMVAAAVLNSPDAYSLR